MNNSDEFEEIITGYGYDGEGVCRVDGKVCFLPFVLKGEKVLFSLTKDNSSFSRGRVLKILKPSEKRVDAPCPYYTKCGGCTYQHTTHENELNIKKELLVGQLKKLKYSREIQIVPSMHEYGYRNKIKLFVGDQKIGLKYRQSNIICDIDECLISNEKINHVIKMIRVFFSAKKLYKFYDQIVIRCEKDMCLINFVMKTNRDVNYQGLFLMLGNNYGIYQTFEGQTQHIMGLKDININAFGLNCNFAVTSFHQVNDEIEENLYTEIVKAVKGKYVVNCYSGSGVLSGLIAIKKIFVTGIELGVSEHNDAERLKDENNLIYMRNICGDCADVLPRVLDNSETIIVDPPRMGMSEVVVDEINESNAKRLIYVSCNSATFIRDGQRLKNFKLKEVKLFDMFPRTGEYEIFAIFDKK